MKMQRWMIVIAIAVGVNLPMAAQVTGSGDANQIAKFTSGSSVGNSAVTETNGNVGIGTTSPGAHLDITDANASNLLRFTAGWPAGSYYLNARSNILAPGFLSYVFDLHNNDHDYPNVLTFSGSNGGVGIGTGSPLGRLHVAAMGSENSGITLGTALDSTAGTTRIDFLGWRDIQPNYLGASIYADRKYTCCGGYPSGGYPGIVLTDLVFATRSDVGADSGISGVSERMRITSGGEIQFKANLKLAAGSGASVTFPDNTVQSTAWNGTTCGGDYAESVDVVGDRNGYEPGDVLVIDPKHPGSFLKSTESYATSVTGIFSTKPGLTGRRQLNPKSDEEVPMAMMGIVPTKVSAENGPIHPGDLLVSSSTPGYAMKGTDRLKMLGAVIGKALGDLDKETGVMEVVVTLQ